MLATQLDRIDADVHQQFGTVSRGHAHGMVGLKGGGDLTVSRCHQFTVDGLNGNAVAQRTAGKGFVLHLGQRDDGAVQAGRQHGILCCGCGCRRGSDNRVLGCTFQIIFQLCLDDGHLGAIHHLYAVALADHAGGTGGFEHILFDQCRIIDRAAQTGCTAIHIGQISGTSQTFHDQCTDRVIPGRYAAGSSIAGVHVRTGVQLDFLGIIAARGLVVKLGDHEAENDVVQHEIHRTDHDHPHPVGLGVALHHTEQHQVDETAGEGHAHAHIQDVHQHEGQTGQYAVHRVHG